jgi:hypothetical protein
VVLHRHYDSNRVARGALDLSARGGAGRNTGRRWRPAREGSRRFFLKNSAANLAGAELQELVRAAVEGNGGRITISQNQTPKEEGRYRQIGINVSSSRQHRTCEDPVRARDAAAVSSWRT